MASPSLRYRSGSVAPRVPITRLHVLLLVCLSLAAAVWGWFVISGQPIGHTEDYLLLLGLYGFASGAFIFSRVREDRLRFFDVPVFLTILMFVEFGLAPLECFVDSTRLAYDFAGHYRFLLKALLYVIAGMLAFWAGCIFAGGRMRRAATLRARPPERVNGRAQVRILQAVVGIYVVAVAVRAYLLTHHLYAYLASERLYFRNLALMQVLVVVSGFGVCSLVVACIEHWLRPFDRKWTVVFWTLFASECFWGLISGMKGLLIQNFVIVALVSSLIQRRFNKGWIVIAVLGAILLYPVSNAYRYVLRGRGEQVTGFASAADVGRQALDRAGNGFPGPRAEFESGFDSLVSRLDLLQNTGLVMALGTRAGQLLGGERWWMLPLYPFVPRFIWHSKPTLLEGARFSVLLGYGSPSGTAETAGTSTAVTFPGDLYVRGGIAGILFGMFVLGVVGQWLASGIGGALDRRRLFVYAAIFLTATDMEIGAFDFWATCIRTFVMLNVIAWFVYGRRRLARGRSPLEATA